MQTVNTYLAVANVNASMEFLERAFAFTRGVVLPDTDGQIRYAEMRHGESVIMLVRRGDATTASGGAAALYTYVGDVDHAAAAARKAGAGVTDAGVRLLAGLPNQRELAIEGSRNVTRAAFQTFATRVRVNYSSI